MFKNNSTYINELKAKILELEATIEVKNGEIEYLTKRGDRYFAIRDDIEEMTKSNLRLSQDILKNLGTLINKIESSTK